MSFYVGYDAGFMRVCTDTGVENPGGVLCKCPDSENRTSGEHWLITIMVMVSRQESRAIRLRQENLMSKRQHRRLPTVRVLTWSILWWQVWVQCIEKQYRRLWFHRSGRIWQLGIAFRNLQNRLEPRGLLVQCLYHSWRLKKRLTKKSIRRWG